MKTIRTLSLITTLAATMATSASAGSFGDAVARGALQGVVDGLVGYPQPQAPVYVPAPVYAPAPTNYGPGPGYGHGPRGGGYGSGGGGYGRGGYTNQDFSLNCESVDGRFNRCGAGAPIEYVRLERQNSRTACIEGQTFGFDRDTVWVNGGCRATFRVSPVRLARDFPLNCESVNQRTTRCDAGVWVQAVRLDSVQSKAPCIEGRTWGQDRSGVWVAGGCRATFRVYPQR